jgi:hypothetical protein
MYTKRLDLHSLLREATVATTTTEALEFDGSPRDL